MAKLNYYDEDIKDEIKDILKEKVSSQVKYDKLLKLISEAPVDQNIYAKLLLIFRKSIFARPKYSAMLELAYQKALFITIMAYDIAILKVKKLNYQDQLQKFRESPKPYSGLTVEDIDRNLLKLVDGRIGAEISSKMASQQATQQVTTARLQAVASSGLPDIKAGSVTGTAAGKTIDAVQEKISTLGAEYLQKILDNLAILIGGKPSDIQRDGENLKIFKITEDELKGLSSAIYNAIEQNSTIVQISDIKVTLRETSKAIERIEKVLKELTKSQDEDLLDTAIGVGFAIVFSGLLVGAIGAIAANLIKKIRVRTVVGIIDHPQVIEVVTKDFWTTTNGQILNEALKDGLKQGLRDRMKYDKVKKYFEEDSKIVLETYTSAQYPVLAMLGFQLEQYSQLLLVLANLGFLTKAEIKTSTTYFENRFKILSITENKSVYSTLLVKEAILNPLLSQRKKLFILYDARMDYFEQAMPDPKYSTYEIAQKLIQSNPKEHEALIYTDVDNKEYKINILSHSSDDLFEKLQNQESRGSDDSNIVIITAEVKFYNIADMDYGVFLTVTDYQAEGDNKIKTTEENYFLAFASHINGKAEIRASKTKISDISSFKYSDVAARLYLEHEREKALLERISS